MATLYHTPFLFFSGLDGINVSNIAIVVYAGIFTSLIAPLLWVSSINLIGPSRTSAVMNFMPIFTALIAACWLSEQWMSYHTIGGMLVLIGTFLTQKT